MLIDADNKTFYEYYGKGSEKNKTTLGNKSVTGIFQAHADMECFGGENHITFSDEGVEGTPTVIGKKLQLDHGNKTIEWFRSKETELKWLITLKEKPANNIYKLKIGGDYKEFDWNYQPTLVDEFGELEQFDMNGEVWVRPINYESLDNYSQRPLRVEGSYAVRHKTKRDHIIGGTNYRSGKAFHIYTPQATDAIGNSVYANLKISGSAYSVTIPQDFLDSAVYPVIINDTFGDSSTGATEHVNSSGGAPMLAIGPYSPALDGTATRIFFYTRAGGNQVNGLFNDSSGDPTGSPIADGADVGGASVDWYGGDFDSPFTIFSANTYWLANQRGDSIAWRYDSGAKSGKLDASPIPASYGSDGVMSTWDITTTTYGSRDYSGYVVFTPSGVDDPGIMTLNTGYWGPTFNG